MAAAYNRRMPEPSACRDLYTVAQVRALERQALASSSAASPSLMQRAAQSALACLRTHWPQARRIVICCGPGNNGGDGFALATLAHAAGLEVSVVALSATAHGDVAQARAAWECDAPVSIWPTAAPLPAADVLVDALYGIGLNRAPAPEVAALIACMNAHGAPVLALDVPSGLDADTGHCPGAAIHARVTLSFIAAKRGLHTGRAADCVGELQLDALGTTGPRERADARLLQPRTLAPQARYANKGDNGHVLVVGGAPGMSGAVRLAGEAALRSGAGLVSIATHPQHAALLDIGRAEWMVHAVGEPSGLAALLERATVLAVGPGLGRDAWGQSLWRAALAAGKPLVLDADGLNLLAAEAPGPFAMPVVLTPHPGEAGRLLGVSTAEVERDRFAAVRAIAARFAAVTVLKGAGSLIADRAGTVRVCPWGNPGMASGGMGDLLTGVIAALLAQGCSAWDAACLGVGLHARAGDLAAAAGERGMLASDLLAPLRTLLNSGDVVDD